MELRDYLRTLKRRLWVLILVPALAVAASLVLSAGSSDGYVTTGTVNSPPLTAANSTLQYAVDFQAVADSGTALAPVVAATKLSTDVLSADLVVSRLSTSSLMQITYTTTDHDGALATKVVQTYGQAILDSVYSASVAQATAPAVAAIAAVEVGQKSVVAAKQAMNDFLAANGYVRPDDALRTATTDLGTIQTQLDLAAVSGDSSSALAAARDGAKKRLIDLGAKAVQFTSLQNEVSKSVATLDAAITDQTATAKTLNGAKPQGLVAITALETPATSQVVLRAAAAGAIGFALALALILVLDARRPRTQQRGQDNDAVSSMDEVSDSREREVSARS